MADKKISQLTAKATAIADTDLVEISESDGLGGYVSKSVTGANIKSGLQATLISGTNIKTINSTTILGSGNLVVSASPSGVAGAIQFSNGSAFSSDASNLFFDDTNNSLGVGQNVPTARMHIKGTAATSATTSLLVQNSAGTSSLQCTDDLSVFNHGKGGQNTNTIFGKGAYQGVVSGTHINNTAIGVNALKTNTSGQSNTAIGSGAMEVNTSGFQNTAVGNFALTTSSNASNNTGIGHGALQNTSSGGNNTAVGMSSLSNNSTGTENTGIGCFTSSGNFSGSVILGFSATATASNQFVVGSTSVNAGTVAAEINTSANVWNVRINGVARKILLA